MVPDLRGAPASVEGPGSAAVDPTSLSGTARRLLEKGGGCDTHLETSIHQGSEKTHSIFNWLSYIKQVEENGRHKPATN